MLKQLLNERKLRVANARTLGDKLTIELDSAHRLNSDLEADRLRLQPHVLRLRKDVDEKEALAEKTATEHSRRQRTFQEREVLVQAKLNRQGTETQVRVGKIEALQLRLEYLDQKILHAKEKLAIYPEAKAFNQQLRQQTDREINDFELRHTHIKTKVKEEEIAKREAEKDVLELQQAIQFIEDEAEDVELCPSTAMQTVAELQKQIEQSGLKITHCEAQVKAINNKIKEFTHLMDKLIEENQILKRMADERKEFRTRNAFQDIGNSKRLRGPLSHLKDEDK